MAQRAGIPKLPGIINAVALISVLSVANVNLYVSVLPTLKTLLTLRVVCCMLLPEIEDGNLS
jgi:amino acid permease